MGDDGTVDGLVQRLFSISQDAHARRQHEVAYHTLTAALHAAQNAHDVSGAKAVFREAREQIAWIDINAPEHRLSTNSAGRHNHPGVYAMLSRQAKAIAQMMEAGRIAAAGGGR
jgi:hypothetical protein